MSGVTSNAPLVAFDVTPVISGRTGIARYATELGGALERQGVELRRFAVGRGAFPLPPRTRHLRIPARLLDRWWQAARWPTAERLVGGADVVHATGASLPATRRPLVVTVHDVAALQHPELHPRRHVEQQRALLATLDRAAAIVTVSASTAGELVQLGIPSERTVVAPLGWTALPDPAPPVVAIEPGYVLTVGETSPRKGYEVVLRALARLGAGVHVVMVGPPAADEQRLRRLNAELGLAQRVTRLGAVNDAELSWLYRHAIALCFSSISEGFGLPVLEALALGLPVIASDIAVTREVAAGAALYVADRDPGAWAEAIEQVAGDAALRSRLEHDGRQRAKEFTWERTAEATLRAYRLALDGMT